ncbi:putative Amidohydrolase 2 [Vibrio nigripulchritudo SFn27]|uniref:Putative Amidohydrolase 2 n=1 Tax=Vibrio nigripulchritudo TaxID=28173 RepID=U4K448_9VIBR|nr:amidohydrolase family protein [Vibrio nigripulchritudo]CCN83585.1 putative Amidohydrolase 2 [Vibrio nigripulchritudo BLFn1]CCN87410.1 putative Amidohydrolase 2 [Vibrio nigripulchritudo SFn27]CCN94789.1 putative Amidohydrolase 2 [Vibrio nigripulchritudo ENn2]CCO40671.1 putative Amidohydrolase 2 [Vibrio nigripulchritudo SFn135]CCO54748.1 putative Amidohydrolase 2 [Vibrio nigripulchritudo Wn13]
MIIDSHLHLWDLDEFNLPWVNDFEPLNKTFSIDAYLSDFKKVDKSVYLEVDVVPEQRDAEIEYVGKLCQNPELPLAAMVASIEVTRADIDEYLSSVRTKAPHVAGFRQVLHTPKMEAGHCLSEAFVKGVQAMGKQGFSFDICIRPQELADAAALIKQCPGTQFVLDHGGIPAIASYVEDESAYKTWQQNIASIAAHSNAVCKVSGLVTQAGHLSKNEATLVEVIAWLKSSFGSERLMFGSDWPVCTLVEPAQAWQSRLDDLVVHWSDSEKQALYFKTAEKVYLSRVGS